MNKTRRRKAKARRNIRKHGIVVFQNPFMSVRWFPITDPEQVRLHELMHQKAHDMLMGRSRSEPLWNIAQDVAINSDIAEALKEQK